MPALTRRALSSLLPRLPPVAAVRALSAMTTSTARPPAVVIAGPSGVGKGTLIGRLRAEYPDRFGFSVSHTTRAPRAGEVDGLHYHFTTADAMRAAIAAGDFVESAEVHGRFYGTSVAAVEKVAEEGRVCILEIDVQGCRLVREKGLPAKFLFVAPPSFEVLEKRLRGRGTEDEASVVKRLENARTEMDAKEEKGLFDRVIVNEDLEAAYSELRDALKEELQN
jgi:guanylate kinase